MMITQSRLNQDMHVWTMDLQALCPCQGELLRLNSCVQVALSLAENELSSFEADASRQTAAANSDSSSTVTLIRQFRNQKHGVLVRAITRLRQGVEQLEN